MKNPQLPKELRKNVLFTLFIHPLSAHRHQQFQGGIHYYLFIVLKVTAEKVTKKS